MDPLAIVGLMVSSLVLASAGTAGFLSLVLHLMSRSAIRVAPVVTAKVTVTAPEPSSHYPEAGAQAA